VPEYEPTKPETKPQTLEYRRAIEISVVGACAVFVVVICVWKLLNKPLKQVESSKVESTHRDAEPENEVRKRDSKKGKAPIIEDLDDKNDESTEIEAVSSSANEDNFSSASSSSSSAAPESQIQSEILAVVSVIDPSQSNARFNSFKASDLVEFSSEDLSVSREELLINNQIVKLLELEPQVESSDLSTKILYRNSLFKIAHSSRNSRNSSELVEIERSNKAELKKLYAEELEARKQHQANKEQIAREQVEIKRRKMEDDQRRKDEAERFAAFRQFVTILSYLLLGSWLAGIQYQHGLASTIILEIYEIFFECLSWIQDYIGYSAIANWWFVGGLAQGFMAVLVIILSFGLVWISGTFMTFLLPLSLRLAYRMLAVFCSYFPLCIPFSGLVASSNRFLIIAILFAIFGLSSTLAYLGIVHLPSRNWSYGRLKIADQRNLVYLFIVVLLIGSGFAWGVWGPLATDLSAPHSVASTMGLREFFTRAKGIFSRSWLVWND
jgi:hypothetical protein